MIADTVKNAENHACRVQNSTTDMKIQFQQKRHDVKEIIGQITQAHSLLNVWKEQTNEASELPIVPVNNYFIMSSSTVGV